MNALVSFDRVFEVLDLVPMIRDAEDAETVEGPASVSFDHVSFSYPTADQVSLAAWNRLPHSINGPAARCCTMSPSLSGRPDVALVGRPVAARLRSPLDCQAL
jgi:ABC-type multidrug transport system fused ATPase/permease subunit